MSARFQLAANVLLSRRLNNLVRIEENVEIDLSYITCAEYQLFIDEKRQVGENRQPAHWPDYRFPSGNAREPITGVRASDAQEFCEWLTQHSVLGFRYRLPTLTEAEENPATEQQIGCWCNDAGKQVIAGIEATQLQDWHNNLAKVTILNRDLYQDLHRDFDRDLYQDLHRELHRELHRVLYRVLDRDFNRVLHRVLHQNLNQVLNRDLNRNFYRDLNRNFYRDLNRVLNRDLYRDIHRDLYGDLYGDLDEDFYGDLKRDLYQVLYQRIEANKASDFLILYFPLVFFIVIYQMLSMAYQAKSQDGEALEQINVSRQESEAISRKYQEKIDDIYPLYLYLVLQDERQAGRIPVWESIRIVRENLELL
ncbi:MAG: SUMF1/EgtB/PvdO family nonheme iron enzyme [Symploca sp. SIO2E6]|nr:SUMF1/EgtB/PvdO family nonheme iron enzyme [Symploca sp. SIO2E6]